MFLCEPRLAVLDRVPRETKLSFLPHIVDVVQQHKQTQRKVNMKQNMVILDTRRTSTTQNKSEAGSYDIRFIDAWM